MDGRRAPGRRSAVEGGGESAAKTGIDRPATDPCPSAGERRRGSSERVRDSRRPPAMDGLRAGGGIDDDENFRAAADALPERDDSRAGAGTFGSPAQAPMTHGAQSKAPKTCPSTKHSIMLSYLLPVARSSTPFSRIGRRRGSW